MLVEGMGVGEWSDQSRSAQHPLSTRMMDLHDSVGRGAAKFHKDAMQTSDKERMKSHFTPRQEFFIFLLFQAALEKRDQEETERERERENNGIPGIPTFQSNALFHLPPGILCGVGFLGSKAGIFCVAQSGAQTPKAVRSA